MTAIEDIKYLQNQGRLVLDMNTRAILELYENLEDTHGLLESLNEAVERIENILNLQADSDEPVQVPKAK